MAIVYHNPRCSKSRQTLALLEANNVPFTVREYLKMPPDKPELQDILAKLGKSPRQLIRSGEKLLGKLKVELDSIGDAELLDLMLRHPILIERPIVVTATSARIGRPPESVLELFSH